MQTMTAKEYQAMIVNPAGEPDNPFDQTFQKQHRTKPAKKPATMLELTEHQIQNMILDRLAFLPKSFFWRENSGIAVSEYKGQKRIWRAGISGIPDIMGVYQGVPVGIEVKRPGKKLSPEQTAFKRRYEECGGMYLMCNDPREVINQLHAEIVYRNNPPAPEVKKVTSSNTADSIQLEETIW